MSEAAGRKPAIALLGGAFNPVTRGHIQLAEYVLQAGQVADEVWLMPCYTHVYAKTLAPAGHRLQMCSLAAAGHPGIKVFAYEIESRAASGSYTLLSRLLQDDRYRGKYDFSMIIGQDNANTFHKWLHHEELRQLLRFIVVPRRGITENPVEPWYHKPPHLYLSRDCGIMDVSSTTVRHLAFHKQWEKLASLVPEGVVEYIRTHQLYLTPDSPDNPAPALHG